MSYAYKLALHNMKNYIETAKRENNTKRGFLIVNRAQAKHIPADPDVTLGLFGELSAKVLSAYPDIPPSKILIVGFAETAPAISSKVAADIGCRCIQTTRENVPDCTFLYFSEEHSHATEQRLVRDGLSDALQNTDRVLFIDDEITTGKTILNIINVIRREFPFPLHFSAVSLLNGMNPEHTKIYTENGIDVLYLQKLDSTGFEQRVRDIPADGNCAAPDISSPAVPVIPFVTGRFPDARKLHDGGEYGRICAKLCADIAGRLSFPAGESAVVIGTEEFMFPAISLAAELKKHGTNAVSHSTTRSPIAVSSSENYPLHTRYELPSFYDRERRTFIYDLKKYDRAVILTDSADIPEEAVNALVNALASVNNKNIYLGVSE